jgi:uridine phosphorylase
VEAAERIKVGYHVGITKSNDSFYSSMAYGGYRQSWMQNIESDFGRARVISGEMEASTLFILASLFGLRAGCVCSIIDVVSATKSDEAPTQEVSIEEALQPKPEFIKSVCECAVQAVRILDKWDRDRQSKNKKTWFPSLSYVPR